MQRAQHKVSRVGPFPDGVGRQQWVLRRGTLRGRQDLRALWVQAAAVGESETEQRFALHWELSGCPSRMGPRFKVGEKDDS